MGRTTELDPEPNTCVSDKERAHQAQDEYAGEEAL